MSARLIGFDLKPQPAPRRVNRPKAAPGVATAVKPAPGEVHTPQPVTPPEVVQGLRGGAHANLLAQGEVTFVLYAPYKPFVSLVGDFNQWNTLSHAMQTDGNGLWWTSIPHPGAGRYGYYVAIDANAHVWVGDPYAREVEWHAQGAWAHLDSHESTFLWSDDGWRTPALRDLVIYECCVRDFGGRWAHDRPHFGTFDDLRSRIGYLRDLGVNAVELMPIQEFPGDSSWGYNPVFYFAPSHTYGTPDDFKSLVDALHAAGIAVILDVAFNHAWGEHPWYRIYPDMYGGKGEWLPNLNPFFHHTPQSVNSWGGVDWDHFCERTTRYFQDVVQHWLREYHVDGFRFDWVCGVDFDHRDPRNPGFNPYHGISALAWAARQVKPDALLVGEFWQLDVAHPDKTAPKLVGETELDAVWNGDFHHTLDAVLNQRWEWEKQDLPKALGGYRSLGFDYASQVVNYTCSHDEVRPEHEIQFYTARWMQRPPGMSVPEMAGAMGRLGLVALFAATGVPMLYAGQEFGDNGARTVDFQPLNWRYLDDVRGAAHFRLAQRLMRTRLAHPALRSDFIDFVATGFAQSRLLHFRRWHESGDCAVVLLNFAPDARTVTVNLPVAGDWHDVVAHVKYNHNDASLDVALAPYGAALLVPSPRLALRAAPHGAARGKRAKRSAESGR